MMGCEEKECTTFRLLIQIFRINFETYSSEVRWQCPLTVVRMVRINPENLHINATHQLQSVCRAKVALVICQESLKGSVGHPQRHQGRGVVHPKPMRNPKKWDDVLVV